MPKISSITLNHHGEYEISDGIRILGALLPSGYGKFTVRMGMSGGFYSKPLEFDDALDFLIERLIISYTNKMKSIKRGANLIYKKKYAHNIALEKYAKLNTPDIPWNY